MLKRCRKFISMIAVIAILFAMAAPIQAFPAPALYGVFVPVSNISTAVSESYVRMQSQLM